MAFLRNTWYVAAWSAEISDAPLGRTLLGERLVFFRDASGAVIAASDLCPHRFAPLHKGKVVEGTIECPYHGLRFDGSGRCVHNPDGDGRIPAGARMRTYPIIERGGCAWIWMGDPDAADPDRIVDLPYLESTPAYRSITGLLYIRASYRLIIDNLMDHAHLQMIHGNTFACDSVRRAKTELKIEPDGSIWANRYGENGPPPAIFDMMWRTSRGPYEGTMDLWAEGGWYAPSVVKNNVGVTLHKGAREDGIETKNAHLLTPETETTTHYFWCIARNFEMENDTLDDEIRQGSEYAFVHEDEVMLHDVQEAMGDRDFWMMKPALLPLDVGSAELRRALDRMIAAEQANTQPSRRVSA
jgi:vanillate O-demethylase monooxygenase subunit